MTSKFDRRQFLFGSAVVAAAGAMGLSLPVWPSPSMRALAASKGLLFGTALRDAVMRDAQFANLIGAQCSIAVSEGALKWDTLRPSPDRYDFRSGDSCLQFTEANHLRYRGHTLAWHEALPDWFGSVVNSSNARNILLEHISTVVRHYAGKMHSWDVVNEIVQVRDGRADGLRDTPWLRFIGPEYVEEAFHAAHEADPTAMLVYNEDQLEPANAGADAKRDHVLTLLKDLLKKGTPIHALGIESHIPAEGFVGSPNFSRFLQEVSDQGLSILVTEMDVCDQLFDADITQRDRQVAKVYCDYLSFLLQFPSVKAVLTWGLSDRYTWLSMHNPRKDGLPVRPLPFDSDLKPTPAWRAIETAFMESRKR